jgi:hypothetical protein
MILGLIASKKIVIMELRKKSGVAGLISAIAIVLVFGLAAAASLQLNAQQTSLVSNTSKTIDLQGKSAKEQLNFRIDPECWIKNDDAYEVTVKVNSTWSDTSYLDSIIFVDEVNNDQSVTDAVYVPDNYKRILPLTVDGEVKVNATSSVISSDRAIIVTKLGQKFVTKDGFPLECLPVESFG